MSNRRVFRKIPINKKTNLLVIIFLMSLQVAAKPVAITKQITKKSTNVDRLSIYPLKQEHCTEYDNNSMEPGTCLKSHRTCRFIVRMGNKNWFGYDEVIGDFPIEEGQNISSDDCDKVARDWQQRHQHEEITYTAEEMVTDTTSWGYTVLNGGAEYMTSEMKLYDGLCLSIKQLTGTLIFDQTGKRESLRAGAYPKTSTYWSQDAMTKVDFLPEEKCEAL